MAGIFETEKLEQQQLVTQQSYEQPDICCECPCLPCCPNDTCTCRHGSCKDDTCYQCDCCCHCFGVKYCECSIGMTFIGIFHFVMLFFGIYSWIWFGYNNIAVSWVRAFIIPILSLIWLIYVGVMTLTMILSISFQLFGCNDNKCSGEDGCCDCCTHFGCQPSSLRYIVVIILLTGEAIFYFLPILMDVSTSKSDYYILNSGAIQNNFTDYYDPNIHQLNDTLWEKTPFSFHEWLFPGSFAGLYGRYKPPDSVRSITYDANKTFQLYIHEPIGDVKRPFILYFHGGRNILDYANYNGGATETWIPVKYWLEQNYGFVGVEYPYFNQKTYAQDGFTVDDILAKALEAYEFISSNGDKWNLDVSRIVLMGRAEGGHLATYVGYNITNELNSNCTMNTNIRGIVNLYGFTEWIKEPINERENSHIYKKYNEMMNKIAFNGDTTDDDRYRVSSINYISECSPQTLSLHGKWNNFVKWELSKNMHDKLKEYNVNNLLLTFDWETHQMEIGFHSLPNQMARYAIERFIAVCTV